MFNSEKVAGKEIEFLFRLTLALHHLNKNVERHFKLSLVQLFVLLRIRALPGTCSQELSGAIGIQPSTLTQTIRRLSRKGYIFVTDDPRDSRRKVIALTRCGKDVVDSVYRELNLVLNQLNGDLKENLQETLCQLSHIQAAVLQRVGVVSAPITNPNGKTLTTKNPRFHPSRRGGNANQI